MAKYFKNIKSFQELKENYRKLLKANHPDNGGDIETMQEINCEYDALFAIWKSNAIKSETITEEEKNETAQSTRKHFYTAYGWAGDRYDSNLTLKEIAKIVRNYVKEKYPTFKFSVRTHYASMCQELHAELTQAPFDIYMSVDDFQSMEWYEVHEYIDGNGETQSYKSYNDVINDLLRKWRCNDIFTLDSYTDSDIIAKYAELAEDKCRNHFYLLLREDVSAMLKDVDGFVDSYNYSDCDSMIDYFNVNFYYSPCGYRNVKTVEKTARIKEVKNDVSASTAAAPVSDNTAVAYTIEESKHTKTGETIYLAKPVEKLDRDTFNTERDRIKSHGGYYSRYTHTFVFSEYPSFLIAGDMPAVEEIEVHEVSGCSEDVKELETPENVTPDETTMDNSANVSESANDAAPENDILDSFFSRYGSPSDTAEHTIHLYARRACDYHKDSDVVYAIDQTTQKIAELEKYIKCLKAHQKQLIDQYNFIATSPIRQKIRLERKKNTWTNKVFYYIVRLDVNLNDMSEVEISRTTYQGKDRKRALDDFAELETCNPGCIIEKDIKIPACER